MIRTKPEYKVLLFTAFAVLFIWVGDAAYDSFIDHEGPFYQVLVKTTAHESLLRIFLTVSFFLYGAVLARFLARHGNVQTLLKKQSAAMETSMDGIAIYDPAGVYVYVNPSYASINGYARPDELIGKTYKNAYGESELARMEQTCFPALEKNGRWRGELIATRKNGSTYFQEASVTRLEDGGRICIIRDITWRKRSEERLRRSETFLNMILNSIRDPFCIFDSEFRIIRANEAYGALKNKRADELIGRKCFEVLANGDRVCEGCVVDKSFHSTDPCAKEKHVVHENGTETWMEIYTYPIVGEGGTITHVMEYTRDITERKKAEDEKRRLIERLEYLSNTDELTGLMNRRALTENLLYEIDRAKRYRSDLSIVLCDIDNFKDINDTLGHDSGDRALQGLSATLKTVIRKTDIVGRHGGDEFLVILPETSDSGADGLAEKLLAIVREIDIRSRTGEPIRITMSIGVACLDATVDTLDSFLKRADDAMYASKQGGRNQATRINR